MRVNIPKIIAGGDVCLQKLKGILCFGRSSRTQDQPCQSVRPRGRGSTIDHSSNSENLSNSMVKRMTSESIDSSAGDDVRPIDGAQVSKAQSHNEDPVLFNEWKPNDFIEGLTQTTKVRHGSGEYAAILPNIDLAKAMRQALIAHLDAQRLEAKVDEEIAVLRPRFLAIRQQIETLEGEMTNPDASSIERTKVEELQAEQDAIYARQAELRARLREHYEDMREGQIQLFTMLQDCTSAAESAMMPAERKQINSSLRSPSSSLSEEGNGSMASDQVSTNAGSEVIHEQDQSVDSNGSEGSECKQEGGADHEELLYNFHGAKEQLEDAEFQLEARHERFAQERFNTGKKGQANTESALGARQCQQTQLLTRAVIRAEKEFQDAKEALLEAGYQPPGSDLSSGFIDDVNDGYRLSLENDIIGRLDRGSVHDWLSNVPESNTTLSNVADALPTPDVDQWKGEGVEMCDSWSMVADGADRRRIDKWRVLATSCRA